MATLPSGATDLCPWDQRRLPREMYVKLFVVLFTVIGAFAHLRHLRREPSRWPLVYIVIIANPIAGMGLILLPLILLPFQAILCRGDRTALRDSACVLLGSRSEAPSLEDSNTQEGPSLTWPKLSKGLATKMILQLALMTQCITSIWLFSRRVKHGSDALYDHRILQLALLGLSVSVMSIIHLICQPRYPSEAYLHHSSLRTSWLSGFRPLLMEPIHYWFYAATIIPIANISGLMYHLTSPPTFSDWWASFPADWSPIYHGFLVSILWGIALSSFRGSIQAKSIARDTGILALTLTPFTIGFFYLHLWILAWIIMPIFGFGQVRNLLSFPANHKSLSNTIYDPNEPITLVPDWKSIWTYGHIPANFTCLEAWKDPLADYVWWLA